MPESISTSATVLVTGAGDGLGYAAAHRFARDGATVYLHAPDSQRGQSAVARLVDDGADPQKLHLVVADFACLNDVSALADKLATALSRLDVLVNAATSAAREQRTYSQDGYELTFAVDYLAARLLTTKLSSILAASHGRVINVSSVRHRGGSIGWNDLSRKRLYTPLAMYAQAKLAMTMYTRTLADTSGSSITAISIDPGRRENEEAAELVAELSSPACPVVNGGFYDGRERARAAALVENRRARERLDKLTSRLLGPAM